MFNCWAFRGNLQTARQLRDTFKAMKFGLVANVAKKEVATGLPLEALITETDAPYFKVSSN